MQNLNFSAFKMSFKGERFGGTLEPSTQESIYLIYPAPKDFTIALLIIRYGCVLKGIGYDFKFEVVSDASYLFNKDVLITEVEIFNAYKDLVDKTQEYVNSNRNHIDGGAIGLFARPPEAMALDMKRILHEARQTAHQRFGT